MTHRRVRSGTLSRHSRAEFFNSVFLALCLLIVVIAPSSVLAQSTDDDIEGPEIVHESGENAVSGLTQNFSATVTDNVEVRSVTLLYRLSLDSEFIEKAMLVGDEPSLYVADIEIDANTRTIEYYIEAVDTAGNSQLRGNSLFALSRTVANGSVAPSKRRTVLYSVFGVIAAGALIALAVGSDSDGDPTQGCDAADGCSVNITIPRP